MAESSIDDLAPAAELARLSGEETQGPPAFHDYMLLDKQYGSIAPQRLIELGGVMGNSRLPHVLRAAGSAIREGVLFWPRRTESSIEALTSDGRRVGDLQKLDDAQALYVASIESGRSQLDSGALPPDREISVIETLLEAAYDNTYKDLICGEVTAQTIQELAERIRSIVRYVVKIETEETGMDGSARLRGKLLLMLGGLQQPEPALLVPGPVRSARRHRMRPSKSKVAAGVSTASVYDMVLFQPDGDTSTYTPAVPVQLRKEKNVNDNPATIMLVGLQVPLRLGREKGVRLLGEVARSDSRLDALDILWAAATTQLPQYKNARKVFPAIHVPKYSHDSSRRATNTA